jgi:hypothetical protein
MGGTKGESRRHGLNKIIESPEQKKRMLCYVVLLYIYIYSEINLL